MDVVRTDRWLAKLWDEPLKICEKLTVYFSDASATEVCHYLMKHGMYGHPINNGKETLNTLIKNDVWQYVNDEACKLRQLWDGPQIPIFIFPANLNNHTLRRAFNGKSGLAFKDKLFLFISGNNSQEDIRALLIHEYNHTCRLNKYKKREEDYTILDSVIIEGLAENAVYELLGTDYVAKWTNYYAESELEKMWQRLIIPAINMKKGDPKHHTLLYGKGFYPKMTGYCVGYYVVKKYIEKHRCSSKKLFHLSSEKIAQLDQHD